MAPRMFSLHSSCEGERGIALDLLQGNLASRCIEGQISRSFSRCGRKPWVSSTCDSDLRDLLMVPIGSQESCGRGRALRSPLGLVKWKRAHLELRQEPQVSSPVLTWVSGCVCLFKQGGRSRRV